MVLGGEGSSGRHGKRGGGGGREVKGGEGEHAAVWSGWGKPHKLSDRASLVASPPPQKKPV